MASTANVRADLLQVQIGALDLFEAQVTFNLVGERIPIKPARFGEEIGSLIGSRNVDITITPMEAAPAIQRTLTGFDGSGLDDAPAVGTLKPTVAIVIKDPTDGQDLGRLMFPACELIGYERDADGEGLALPKLVYRAMRDSNGKVYSVGPAA